MTTEEIYFKATQEYNKKYGKLHDITSDGIRRAFFIDPDVCKAIVGEELVCTEGHKVEFDDSIDGYYCPICKVADDDLGDDIIGVDFEYLGRWYFPAYERFLRTHITEDTDTIAQAYLSYLEVK